MGYELECSYLEKKGEKLMISFAPLWRTMEQKGVSQYKLIKDYKISAGQIARLRSNCNVNTHTLNMLCEILDCSLDEIAEFVKE